MVFEYYVERNPQISRYENLKVHKEGTVKPGGDPDHDPAAGRPFDALLALGQHRRGQALLEGIAPGA